MSSDAEPRAPGLPRWAMAVVVGVILLDLVLPLANLPTSSHDAVGVIYVGYLIAQVGLHASMATLARGFVPLRILSFALVAVLILWNVHSFESTRDQFAILSLLAGLWFMIATTMALPIVCGFRLRQYSRMQLASNLWRVRAQFSLKRLAILVTLACVLVGIAVRTDWTQFPEPLNDPTFFVFSGLFTLQVTLLVTCVLLPRRSWLPGLLSGGVTLGPGIGMIVHQFDPHGVWVRFLLFIVPAVLQLAALLGLRSLGYRLWPLEARPRPAAAPAVTGLGSSDGPIGAGKSSALLDPKS